MGNFFLPVGNAAIGFAFDIYELLMLPLVIKPALAALGRRWCSRWWMKLRN